MSTISPNNTVYSVPLAQSAKCNFKGKKSLLTGKYVPLPAYYIWKLIYEIITLAFKMRISGRRYLIRTQA